MRKLFLLVLLISAISFQFCSSTKSAQSKAVAPPKLTYNTNVAPIMLAHCQPCHFPPKGNKRAYDTYAAVSSDVDSILSRINKNPGQKGFMPFKHSKLPDSTINVFVQWKADGLLEK